MRESMISVTGFPYRLPRAGQKGQGKMEHTKASRQKLLLAMTMMEAAALDLLDTIAIEREALREDAEAEALAESERVVV